MVRTTTTTCGALLPLFVFSAFVEESSAKEGALDPLTGKPWHGLWKCYSEEENQCTEEDVNTIKQMSNPVKGTKGDDGQRFQRILGLTSVNMAETKSAGIQDKLDKDGLKISDSCLQCTAALVECGMLHCYNICNALDENEKPIDVENCGQACLHCGETNCSRKVLCGGNDAQRPPTFACDENGALSPDAPVFDVSSYSRDTVQCPQMLTTTTTTTAASDTSAADAAGDSFSHSVIPSALLIGTFLVPLVASAEWFLQKP